MSTTVRVQSRTKWSFEGWRDVEHLCQWKCATGPMSKCFRLSNKHACECWLDCARKPAILRANLCVVCLHMHNNYCMALCMLLCLCCLFVSVSLFVNTDKSWEWFTLFVGQYEQCTIISSEISHLPLQFFYPCSSLKNQLTVGKPQTML